jgi:DNA segregation ATPase FtsK/SpoIIIE-like protein
VHTDKAPGSEEPPRFLDPSARKVEERRNGYGPEAPAPPPRFGTDDRGSAPGAAAPGDESAEPGASATEGLSDAELYGQAVDLAEKVGRVSVSLLQRKLGIGARRAQELMDRLVKDGLADA